MDCRFPELAYDAGHMARNPYRPIPLRFTRLSPRTQRARVRAFADRLQARRSVRDFASEPVPFELVTQAIRAASSAPSGANMQPWRFVVVGDSHVKRRIRESAEAEERESYARRMPEEWLAALAPLGTDWRKPFLEIAPWLIVVFRLDHDLVAEPGGGQRRVKHYYATESVGIACGMLIAALHLAGLATLTHTPSPMGFLGRILGRPAHEKPFLLIPVGYPAPDAMVPAIARKPLAEVLVRV
jgi:iodotyrosine deiodinase